ncbi:STAS domain-containing protein [Bacillus sp. Marseille-Q1617]|uniref:STAS domain-containing protein n=1 Tax=Bacillus sp. Marseille-Q1617 TaxID=2736887 RepID=UPI00158F5D63|nr:STAS domain-containing protein [Bacillus sp. Marseille-Q1617]
MNRPIPIDITGTDALNSIGENIIIANKDYTVTWMNTKASTSMTAIAPLFGLNSAEDMIGMNMDEFHELPPYQRRIMDDIHDGHRARINIKERLAADIVITPITSSTQSGQVEGYMVMLMDVTSRAEEEKRRETMIRELSVPILHIWDKTIALPLKGELDLDRGEIVISTVLEECVKSRIEYVMISISGISRFDDSIRQNLQKLYDCLKLIGVECIIVGITPELAISIGEFENVLTFSDSSTGLKYIMSLQEKESV